MLKLKLAAVAVLAVVIAMQVVYLVRQIRGGRTTTTAAGPAGAPGVGPMGAMPAPAPGGGPKPGRPGVMPKAAPPPNAMPPGPNGGGNAPGSMPGMSPEILPYNEILLGFSKLGTDAATALSAAQKQKAAPVLKAMAELLNSPGGRADLVVATALQTLRPEQIAYMTEHRAEPPPPDAEAGSEMPDPSFVGGAAIRLLTRRAAEPPGKAAAAASPSPLAAGLAVEDVLGGLLKLEPQKSLAVTPQQAAALLKCIKPMVAAREQIDARKKELVDVLNPKQRERLLAIHDELMSKGMEVISPQELLTRVQAQVQ